MTDVPAAPHTSGSILVIDDDTVAAGIFEQILDTHGYRVRVAADAESGLVELQRQVPAAILMDLHLPMTQGLSLLRQIRETSGLAAVPIAIITGDYLVDDHMVREIETLAARLHFKPLWEEDLIRLVDELVTGDPAPPSQL